MALPDDASLLLRKITKNATIQVEKDKKLILMIKFYWFERTNETYIFLKSFNPQPLFNSWGRQSLKSVFAKNHYLQRVLYIKLIMPLLHSFNAHFKFHISHGDCHGPPIQSGQHLHLKPCNCNEYYLNPLTRIKKNTQ